MGLFWLLSSAPKLVMGLGAAADGICMASGGKYRLNRDDILRGEFQVPAVDMTSNRQRMFPVRGGAVDL